MRKIVLLALFSGIGLSIMAQEVIESKELPRADRILISLFHDVWSGMPVTSSQKGWNPGFSFALMYDGPIKNGPVALAVGAGMSFHNLRSNSMPSNEMNNGLYTGRTLFVPIDSIAIGGPVEYSTNRLNLTYFEIPAELRLRFRTGENYLKIALGASAGYLIDGHTTYKGDDLAGLPGDVKFKSYMIRNIEHLRYGVHGRIAWSNYGLFYNMQLTSIFRKSKGPVMIPASIGFTFGL